MVATCNVRTLAVKGKNGYGHDERVLAKGRQLGCDFIGLQETRRSGSATFTTVTYHLFRSGQRKNTDFRQGLYGVGLAVKESIRLKPDSINSLTNDLCRCASSWLGNAGQFFFRRCVRS